MTKYIRVNSRNSKKTVYHTNTNCKRVTGDMRLVDESEIEYHELTLCTWCDATVEDPNAQYEQDHGYYEALKEAAKDD